MLVMDHQKKPDTKALQNTNLGDTESQLHGLPKAGLTPVVNFADNLSELRNLLIKNGSAIVSMDGELGGHVVVVDEVAEDLSTVRLRDPYHGWEITVTAKAFLKRCREKSEIEVIQVKKGWIPSFNFKL